MGVGGERHAPAAVHPWREPVSILRAWCLPGPAWMGAKISLLPGFDPWTVQDTASLYADYATTADS